MNTRISFFAVLFLFAFLGLNAQNPTDFSGHYGEFIQEEGKDYDRGFHLALEDGKYSGMAYRNAVDGTEEASAPLENLLIDPNSNEISFSLDGESVKGTFTDDGNGNWLLSLSMEKDELRLTRRAESPKTHDQP